MSTSDLSPTLSIPLTIPPTPRSTSASVGASHGATESSVTSVSSENPGAPTAEGSTFVSSTAFAPPTTPSFTASSALTTILEPSLTLIPESSLTTLHSSIILPSLATISSVTGPDATITPNIVNTLTPKPSSPNFGKILAISFSTLGGITVAVLVVACKRKRQRRRERAIASEPVVFVASVPIDAKAEPHRSVEARQHSDRADTTPLRFPRDTVDIGDSASAVAAPRDRGNPRAYSHGGTRGLRQEVDGGFRVDTGTGVPVRRQQSVGTMGSESTTTPMSIETLPPPYAQYD